MALRADSYGSVNDVRALTRHLLDGAIQFDEATRPTLGEVEDMIDRWSAILNMALVNREVSIPVTHEVAVQVCNQWVIRQAAAEVELTQRGTGWNENDDSRIVGLRMGIADEVADSIAAALRNLGVTETGHAHSGLTFTGPPAQDERPDSDNEDYEQPLFTRRQFDL